MIGRHERTILDLGTGDGSAVLRVARRDPGSLAIGVDTDAAGLREASRRAARPVRKGGLPNALFLVGEAATALAVLRGRVDQVRITLPWGSLLRVVLHGDQGFAHAVAGALWPGGVVRVLISVVERDAPAIGVCAGGGPALLDAFAAALEEAGLAVLDRHLATAADVADLGSSWAKRLGIPARRPACVLVAHKREEGCSRQSECQYWI